MGLSWLKIREDLHEDPAVLSMAAALDTRPEHVVGYCVRFWAWVSRNCHGGSVTNVTPLSLERVLNLPGFCDLLIKAGWLECREVEGISTIVIPNYERHLSEGAKERALAAERKARERAKSVTKTSRCERDTSVTREEKRREEKSKSNKFDPTTVELPRQLQTDAFRRAWSDWCQARRENGKPLKPKAVELQLAQCAAWGSDKAVEAIKQSITNSYQGLFEPKPVNGQKRLPLPGETVWQTLTPPTREPTR